MQCKDVDQACYALVQDLRQRGLLDSNPDRFGWCFGATIYSQGGLRQEKLRTDHHRVAYDVDAGGGQSPGLSRETEDFSLQHRQRPRSIHDSMQTVEFPVLTRTLHFRSQASTSG